ncbi:uncharacterized protein J4E84_011127, partial [Alternaria hordeiaustralica]|uniref:uncharacterized protein n=1 Tax=Alternaria hordeiaustralica TaxID=1187925 RepID=UPI0020C2AF12
IGVEEWRASALRTIDERMALFDSPEKTSRPATRPDVSDPAHGLPHRALGVKELLEQILRELMPSTLYVAWNVSKGWRDMVSYILQTRFHSPHPCAPVDHGESIQPGLGWMQPSESEIVEFQDTVDRLYQAPQPETFRDTFLLTARLPHADKVPNSTSDIFRTLCQRQFAFLYAPGGYESLSVEALLSRVDGPRWLDLSQFEVNPYFIDRFGDCLQLTRGSFVITTKPRLQHCLRDDALPTGFQQLVDTMFLTNPPCKALGIYALCGDGDNGIGGFQLVEKVHRADGIRVGDFLPQIRQHIPTAIESWRHKSQDMREYIAEEKWTKFSGSGNKLQSWWGPGLPKLLVFLESAEQPRPTFAQCTHFGYQDYNNVFRKEWNEAV